VEQGEEPEPAQRIKKEEWGKMDKERDHIQPRETKITDEKE